MKELDVVEFYKHSVEVLYVMNKMVAGVQYASENRHEISNLSTIREAIELATNIFGDTITKMEDSNAE